MKKITKKDSKLPAIRKPEEKRRLVDAELLEGAYRRFLDAIKDFELTSDLQLDFARKYAWDAMKATDKTMKDQYEVAARNHGAQASAFDQAAQSLRKRIYADLDRY